MALSRRNALKTIGAGSTLLAISNDQLAKAESPEPEPFRSAWHQSYDRVWLGADVWANPMEDWRVVDGSAECQTAGGDRNIHCITHQLTNGMGSFKTSVVVSQVEVKNNDGGVGFKVGVKSDINEFRSNCFAKNGWRAGIVKGSLFVAGKRKKLAGDVRLSNITLELSGSTTDENDRYTLKLTVFDSSGQEIGSLANTVTRQAVLGNLALVNNFDPKMGKAAGARYRFSDWKISGDAFTAYPERKFGPILWSMYSLSDSRTDDGFVMKITALTGPLGESDSKDVELLVKQDGNWKSLGNAKLNEDAWTATFRIVNWNEKVATPYKLVYQEKHKDGRTSTGEWSGNIQPNPSGRPVRLAALTCQNDYAFPYEPVANNVVKLKPDMIYFSGDQLYESHGGFGIIRDPAKPAILNYLRKFYMFGWAFRESIKDAPTICIPDDHDVFQGNIWGEAGAKMTSGSTSSKGGYREPARMVNVVHRTCASHHPDFYDARPVQQNISVYYGDMVYGGVSFAILGDRQFKSGPERVDTGSGRADHVQDRNFDTSKLDKPGLVLLGDRQEEFLKQWGDDWRGHSIKVLLSQTVFAGVATHHGGFNGYLKADLDSGGWPQTARNRTVEILRKAMPLHINGDQHLTTLVQYGVTEQRDGCWSFCTPAIAAGYPRWWRPDEIGMEHKNRPSHGIANTGEYVDGFGNKAYVYAVGNPEVASKRNRYERAHQKGSGFGLVTIDPKRKTYKIESFRFLIDATDGKKTNQFPGWPVVIEQTENRGENKIS